MKREELVLFYQFRDDEKLALAQKTLHRLGIHTKVLPEEAWREKVGYLLGLKGFRAANPRITKTMISSSRMRSWCCSTSATSGSMLCSRP